MYQSITAFFLPFFLFLGMSVSASANSANDIAAPVELQGYGAFSQLNKDWMIMALYAAVDSTVDSAIDFTALQRLEIKIATKKFSNRRFRALWLEAIAIEYGADSIAVLERDLEQFFDMLKGPLLEGDTLVIERTKMGAEISINYHQLAQVSDAFLPMIVQSLVGKHPPTQALKSGLLGESSIRDQMNLSIRFERLEPTLPRISEISKWGKRIIASK